VLIIFNRPELTARAIDALRAVRPARLFVIADGPRPAAAGDAETCALARAAIDKIDWPCTIERNFSDANLGCAGRIPGGLSWVFEKVEEAIILEDDAVPHPSFFRFCDEMLARYRDDERVMSISGPNYLGTLPWISESYCFTRYGHFYAWATWRRAWRQFDATLATWPDAKCHAALDGVLREPAEIGYWSDIFDYVHAAQPRDIWDYAWLYACWTNNGLSVYPQLNLVQNVGFGADATHTSGTHLIDGLEAGEIGPITHPQWVTPSEQTDNAIFEKVFGGVRLRRAATPLGRLRRRLALRTRLNAARRLFQQQPHSNVSPAVAGGNA
jgi:hypothetical protein